MQCVIDLLSEDEIHIAESFGYSRPSENSRTGKRILFIVTSEDKRYYDWIPSMVYSLFFDELYHLTAIDPDLHESVNQHLTFLMDEFANVTLPDSFVEKLSTMRSRNMSAVIIVQNLIQLKRKFPKFDMDKDLIGNCSIIDILGAPDMDSCEYLSKHFGTQTIHKASDSDAKDYKGQSSRSEDVMEKSLLSAEDIFAMKKDGECAIVIKGADPLFEPKCKMENTEFIKLLCRKNKPYDPKKRQMKRYLEEHGEGFVLTGKDAVNKAAELRSKGTPILRLTMEDIQNMQMIGKMKEPVTTLKLTADMQRSLRENYEKYMEDHCNAGALDFEKYKDKDDTEADAIKKYQKRCMVVQKLTTIGYTRTQIKALYPLIMQNLTAEEILAMFPPRSGVDEIKNLTKVFS